MSVNPSAPELPAELAALEDTLATFTAPSDIRSVCGRHGPQNGPNCAECDKHFPEAVAARASATPTTAGVPTAEVQKMIQAAVKQALDEERAFRAYQSSQTGAPTTGGST